MTHNEQKSQSIETNPKMMQIIELTGKNIKIVIIVTVFHMFKKIEGRLNVLETCMV